MKFYGRTKETACLVKANADKLELMVALQNERPVLLHEPERAFRVAGPDVYRAISNFSTIEIDKAIAEARVDDGTGPVVLLSVPYLDAEDETKRAPKPAPVEIKPAPVVTKAVDSKPATNDNATKK